MPKSGSQEARELDRVVVSGLAWTGGVKGLAQAVSWLMTIVVMRLLTPTDYGIFGMAMLFIQLAGMAAEFGLGSALVYFSRIERPQIAQLHGLSVILGVMGLVCSFVLAYPFSLFFRTHALFAVVLVLASTFLIDSFRTVPAALLARDMRFKELAALDLIKAVIVPAATIVFALFGLAYWALVLGNVVSSIVATMLVLAWRPQRAAWPRLKDLRSMLSLSTNVIVARLAWWGYSNADFAVAGRLLGATALGFYTCAWTVACAPMEKIVAIFSRVMPPLFSKVNDQPALAKRYLLSITEVLMILVAPASVGVALVAHDLIVVVLGSQWELATTPLRLLCVYALFQAPSTLLPHVLNSTGHSRLPMYFNIAMLVILPAGFAVGAVNAGINGVASVWAMTSPIVQIVMLRYTLVAIDLRMADYLKSLGPTVGAVAGMAVVVVLSLTALAGASGPVRLVTSVAAGAASYAAILLVFHRARLRTLWFSANFARDAASFSA